MGRNKLDKIVVVDLEATCWEHENGSKQAPGGQTSEIIEIGACFLEPRTGKVSQKTSYLVRPTLSEVSDFCTELTTITPELLKEHGIPFGDAINKLKKEFGTRNKVWASWGDYDRVKFEHDCRIKEVKYPFGRRHINVKTLFSLINGLEKELGMAAALKYYDMDLKGTHHRGHDDAYNIARIMAKMLSK